MINLNVRARKSASDPQSLFGVVRNIGKTGGSLPLAALPPPRPTPTISRNCVDTREKDPNVAGIRLHIREIDESAA